MTINSNLEILNIPNIKGKTTEFLAKHCDDCNPLFVGIFYNMEKYYYRIDQNGICQRCENFMNIRISSDECLTCVHNEGYDFAEGFVKCYYYHLFLENKLLREKNEMLETQVLDLLTIQNFGEEQ